MKSIWVQCSNCHVIFDREEGRRGKNLVCPQCKERLQEEKMIKTDCYLCERLTLTMNGVCPWCEEEETVWEDSIQTEVIEETESEEIVESIDSEPEIQIFSNKGSVDYVAGRKGNLELKTTKNGVMTMGYQYRLLKPEAVFHGQLRLFLNEMSKSKAAGRLAIELAAASIMENGKPTPICCLNVRVFTNDSPQTLYRLCQIACEDVCQAFDACGIVWKKARFDDEGTVGVMPIRGYGYLARACFSEHRANKNWYTKPIDARCSINPDRLHGILIANPDSGISLQLMPTVLNPKEMKVIDSMSTDVTSIYHQLDEGRETLYAFTCTVWGSAMEEIIDVLSASTRGRLEGITVSMKKDTEYEDVTINPWNLCRRLCDVHSDSDNAMYRLPCLITFEELSNLFGSEQNQTAEEHFVEPEENQILKQLSALSVMVQKNHEELQRLSQRKTDDSSRELLPSELAYLGVSSKDELGMTDIQFATLEDTIFSIRPMGILNGGIIETDNYLPYTFMLGYLYELLMKECYYNTIYEPYCKKNGQQYESIGETELICYEMGPGGSLQKWEWRNMAQDFSSNIWFGKERWNTEQWYEFFKDLNRIRRLRNKVHVINRKGEFSFVNKTEACQGIERMFAGPQSLMRRIALCSTAEARFEGK